MRCPAGPAISTWLCAIPRSATKALLGRTAQLEPAGMRSTRRMAVPQFPLGTLQRDRSAGDPSAHGGAAAAPQLGRATALLAPGHAAAPAPRRGWLWGGRSPSQPRHRTQAGKVRSQPSQTGTARVSRGRGERGRGCQCRTGGAGEAEARMGLALSQPKNVWASLDGLGASPRLGGEAEARPGHRDWAGGGREGALALPGGHRAAREGKRCAPGYSLTAGGDGGARSSHPGACALTVVAGPPLSPAAAASRRRCPAGACGCWCWRWHCPALDSSTWRRPSAS